MLDARDRCNAMRTRRRSQQGSVAVMFAASLFVIVSMFGMALDLTRLYNRQSEMQNVADAAALAAARELNGTSAGLTTAVARAHSSAELLKYQYDNSALEWTDAALRFGESATTSTWVELAEAKLTPGKWRFVKVETSELSADYAAVDLLFIPVVAPERTQANMTARAIAGRSATNVVPLAVCAMAATPAEGRAWPGPPAMTELVEYGFRRGVAYDLMQLNPGGTAPEHFVVDPYAVPGDKTEGIGTNMSDDVIGPSICTGTVALSKVVNTTVAVRRSFPIKTFYQQLNSRFDRFNDKASGAYCNPDVAPPDANIAKYEYGNIGWMITKPAGQAAASTTAGGKLRTVADLAAPASDANTAPMYGPLWSFARAVPFSNYQATTPEPAAGYATFAATSWASLYKPGQPAPKSNYPATSTPYAPSSGDYFAPPSTQHKGVRNRRVLNVPLLACPGPKTAIGAATVLAIGKFFMTVPATDTSLVAEFGGIVSIDAIGGNVELYP